MNVNRSGIGVLWLAGIALLAMATLSLAQSSSTTTSSSTKKTIPRKSHHKRRPRGQQKMDAQRIQAIQEALIREHYLDKLTGKWDTTTQQALQHYQADNGWQSKVVPDSRALIKLGLGPDHDHLLNPESAMTTTLPVTHTTPDPDAKK